MTDPNHGAGADAPPEHEVELAHDAGNEAVVEGTPDFVGADAVFRSVGHSAHVVESMPMAAEPVYVDPGPVTDPHRDGTTATGMNDDSHSDSPIEAQHDAPAEEATDPVTETPPEEAKHEEPPPEKHEEPPPEHHDEPTAGDSSHSGTEGSDGHHD